jgi:hypothetical protein
MPHSKDGACRTVLRGRVGKRFFLLPFSKILSGGNRKKKQNRASIRVISGRKLCRIRNRFFRRCTRKNVTRPVSMKACAGRVRRLCSCFRPAVYAFAGGRAATLEQFSNFVRLPEFQRAKDRDLYNSPARLSRCRRPQCRAEDVAAGPFSRGVHEPCCCDESRAKHLGSDHAYS